MRKYGAPRNEQNVPLLQGIKLSSNEASAYTHYINILSDVVHISVKGNLFNKQCVCFVDFNDIKD